MIVAPTTAVGAVDVSFVSNPWARIILTRDTFKVQIFIFLMNRIDFDSIWWKHAWYEFGAYRTTT